MSEYTFKKASGDWFAQLGLLAGGALMCAFALAALATVLFVIFVPVAWLVAGF